MKAKDDRFTVLLRAYPKAYRERRGDEILSTLLEDASTRACESASTSWVMGSDCAQALLRTKARVECSSQPLSQR
jgi:hypothetical protein